MVVTCGDCGARFRLDAALMKGAKEIRVRCRRCGGKIVVLCPEDPPVLSAADVVPIDTGVPSSEPKGGTSPSPPDEMTVPPSSGPAVDLREAVAGEDTGLPPPLPKADADLPHALEKSDPPEEIIPPGPEREVIPGGRSHTLKYMIVAGRAILLLAGGTLYFGTTKPGGERSGKLVPIYDIRDVIWSFEKQAASGTLFVIKGKVANSGKGPSDGIGIRVTLQGKDNQALAEKTAFAGNILDVASLRQMDRAGIDAVMSNRFGEGNGNKEIPPGKVLPFMALFFDPPGEIAAVMVKAIDVR